MSARKFIATVTALIVLFQITRLGFNYWFNNYQATGEIIPATIVNVDRIDSSNGSGYVRLKIISETGEEHIFKRAYESRYEPGAKVKLHEYQKEDYGWNKTCVL